MFRFLSQFVYQWVDPYTGSKSYTWFSPPNLKTAWRNARRNVRMQRFYDACHGRQSHAY